MVILAAPFLNADGSYSVRVVDATATPHADDTRGPGQSGVGTGTPHFQVDGASALVAYQFTPRGSFKTQPISIGRVTSIG
jgi:hypothetical protein